MLSEPAEREPTLCIPRAFGPLQGCRKSFVLLLIGNKGWTERSIERVCSAAGYNQWLENGIADNSFEACFSQVESLLPKVFRALEKAATRKETLLDAQSYENLCRYCTMLKLSSPAAKAGAVAALTIQLNWEVENNKRSLLSFFEVPEEIVVGWRKERELDRRIILDCDNPTQFAFRVHYSRTCDVTFAEFLRCKWIIGISPFDLPISDLGLVPIHLTDLKAHQYFLPIGPRLLLEGVYYHDEKRNSREPQITSHFLSQVEAEVRFESICLSATAEILATHKDPKVREALARKQDPASAVVFNRVSNPTLITSSGMTNSDGGFRLRTVPSEEYVRFVHSFVTPEKQN